MKKLLIFLVLSCGLSAAPQAVVFDFGGVMVHSNRKAMADFVSHLFNQTDLKRNQLDKHIFEDADPTFWDQFVRKEEGGLPPVWQTLYESAVQASIGIDLQMYLLVDQLKCHGVQVALLSNVSKRHAKQLRKLHLYDPFDRVFLSHEIGVKKPHPAAYKTLITALNLPPEEIVFIDNRRVNVEAARDLGIDAIQFESAEQVRRELEARGLLTSVPATH